MGKYCACEIDTIVDVQRGGWNHHVNRARIPIEFQLADEGMQGMCRRGADLRGPLKFIATFGSSKVA